MPMTEDDSERLERVYQRAGAIRLTRRVRVLAVAVPMLLVGAAVVLAAPNDPSRLEVAEGPVSTTTSTFDDPPLPTPTTTGVTLPELTTTSVSLRPPTTPKPSRAAPMATTTTTTPVYAENCGGYSPGDSPRPKPPAGMVVTVEASKQTVRRGEEVVLTLRARWTGDDPYSHMKNREHLLFAKLPDGQIIYQNQYDPNAPSSGTGQETFAPGEEKTYSVTWNTAQACGPYQGMRDQKLRTGTYIVEGTWESTEGTWQAEPATFELTE